MTRAYINRLGVAVPEHEVHGTFVRFAERLLRDRRSRLLFERMAARADIEQRWSCLAPAMPGAENPVQDVTIRWVISPAIAPSSSRSTAFLASAGASIS